MRSGVRPAHGLRVAALTAALGGAAFWAFHLVLEPLQPPGSALPVPWWTLRARFFLTEAFPVHLHFRSEAHSLSLSELGLVLGLFLADAEPPPARQLSAPRSLSSSYAGSAR